ncbi:MAG TPA: GWxTD domain-containing protein [bacterium]|nr:GWxTD domain-containing protein [bacterium]
MGESATKTARRAAAALAAMLVLTAAPVPAQVEFSNLPPPGVPVFDLDWAAFRAGKDSLRIECYYKIVNPRLSYVRRTMKTTEAGLGTTAPTGDTAATAEFYVAAYEISAILASHSDRQAASVSERENYALPDFEETRNPSGYLVNILSMTVAPDDYELSVTLTDRVSGGSYTRKENLPLNDARGDRWPVGGPMFFDPTAEAPDLPRFKHGDLGLVPSVTRAFASSKDRIAMYLEIYRDVAPDAAFLQIEADQRYGRKTQTDTIPVIDTAERVPIVYRSPLTDFKTGEATLRVRLMNAAGEVLGTPLEIPFWVDWSMAGMVEENWEEAVNMLVHIATHDELKSLRNTPPEKRVEAFTAFWRSKDPSPETDDNEWQDEYYRRIRHADLHFTTAFMRGWRTDYGTVYVKYGEPDEIERHPFERGSKPYQIWSYYAQRRRFLFVDVNGNGEYQLQYPYDGIIR